MIRALEGFWADQGCVLMQPYHTELAAGTMNPATFLRCLGPAPWKTAYVEPAIRPADGRYGENPYRVQHYCQYQGILKPAPSDRLQTRFAEYEEECRRLLDRRLPLPAYDQVLKCSHAFNLLDARGALSVTERAAHIGRVRTLAREVAQLYLDKEEDDADAAA